MRTAIVFGVLVVLAAVVALVVIGRSFTIPPASGTGEPAAPPRRRFSPRGRRRRPLAGPTEPPDVGA